MPGREEIRLRTLGRPRLGDLARTALNGAARGGHTEIARLLLEAGARVDAPMIAAASRGHRENIDLLIAHGSDPDRGVAGEAILVTDPGGCRRAKPSATGEPASGSPGWRFDLESRLSADAGAEWCPKIAFLPGRLAI